MPGAAGRTLQSLLLPALALAGGGTELTATPPKDYRPGCKDQAVARKKLTPCLTLLRVAATPAAHAGYAGYADDRAQIEDLMGHYRVANDGVGAQAYADTFTEDGLLVHGTREARVRAEIQALLLKWRASLQANALKDGPRPPANAAPLHAPGGKDRR